MSGTIITLTAIPPRFAHLGPTLASLTAQDLPAPVELWIPAAYRRFPRWDGALPEVPPGVAIRRCPQDWGPATKVVPAALARRGQGVELLFCDDDSIYAPDWHRRFRAARAAHPRAAIAAIGRHLPGIGPRPRARTDRMPRMKRRPRAEVAAELAAQGGYGDGPPVALVAASGHADLVEGWGGVLVRPEMFAPALAEGPGACWPVDDIWLSGLLEAGGTPIWVEAAILPPGRRNAGGIAALTPLKVDGQDRAALEAACIARLSARFGIWSPHDLRPPDPPWWRRALNRARRLWPAARAAGN